MFLSAARLSRMLCDLGQDVTWRKSYACPCVDAQTGQIQADCPQCNGIGRLWDAPVSSVVGIASGNAMRRFERMEILDAGDAMVVLPYDQPIYAMGEFDRLSFTQKTEAFSMVVVAGIHNRLRFEPKSIERVFWLVDDQPVDGAIPAFDVDGNLTWNSGEEPPAGAVYSVSGRRYPEYYCYLALPWDRPNARGQPLPRKILVRRLDLLRP